MRIQPMMLQASVISRSAYWEIGGLAEQLRTREDTLAFFKLAFLYPACAVAGCGAVMSSDGAARLTRMYDGESLVYGDATIFLYRELLASLPNIRQDHRQLLTESLSVAYFGMGRVLLRQRKYWNGAKNLVASYGVSPRVFGKQLLGSVKRNILTARSRDEICAESVAAKS